MTTVILLRGVNLGPANRLPMAELRAALAEAGLTDPRTLLQSGNVVVGWEGPADELSELTQATIAERFGLRVPVIVRTASELADIVEHNPLPEQAAAAPKRLQVTFLQEAPDSAALAAAEATIKPGEQLHVRGRELYAWHPDGIAGSKLALALTGKSLGAHATSRNWATITRLLTIATDAA